MFIFWCILFAVVLFFTIPQKHNYAKKNSPGSTYTIESAEEIDTSGDPIQKVSYLSKPVTITTKDKYFVLKPVASYKISGIVLATNTRFYDKESEISPIDIGIGWGKIADPALDKLIKYKSSNRFLHWHYDKNFPYSFKYLNSHASHSHIIPADENIFNAIKGAKKNEKITLEGYLVNVKGYLNKNNQHVYSWKSSITRHDTGWGACEVFYVERTRLGDTFYE